MRRLQRTLTWAALLLLAAPPAWGGNRALIERRIQELDRVNRAVVRQLPDLPRDGRVTLRARVPAAGPARILESEVVPAPERTAPPADAAAGSFRLREALRDFDPDVTVIEPYRDANRDGAYPFFREALVRAFGRRPQP